MASSQIDLGRMDLVSTISNLQVQVQSSARFASPSTGVDEWLSRLTTDLRNGDLRYRPWLSMAHDYQFVLEIEAEDALKDVQHLATEKVAATMSAAPLWRDLLLDAYATETSLAHNGDHGDTISVSLRYAGDDKPSRPSMHKLCTDVPFHDAKPPPGILCDVLESVHVSLTFTNTDPRKRPRVDPRHDALAKLVRTRDDDFYDSAVLTLEDGLLDAELEDSNHATSGQAQADSMYDDGDDDWQLQSIDEDLFQATMTFGEGPESGVLPSTTDVQPPRLLKRSSSSYERVRETAAIAKEDMLRLIDRALKLSIFPTRRVGKDVRIVRQESFMPLAKFAPSLWLPNYLQAVSNRALFVPTLSHALINVGGKDCRSAALRSKVRELTRQIRVIDPDNHGTTSGDSSMSVSLWRLLQQACYDPSSQPRARDTTRFHQDLDPSAQCGDGEQDLSHDMLLQMRMDTSQANQDSSGCYGMDSGLGVDEDDLGDEDLFETGFPHLGDSPLSAFESAEATPSLTRSMAGERAGKDKWNALGGFGVCASPYQCWSSDCRAMFQDLEDDLLSHGSSVDSMLFDPDEEGR